MAKLKPLKRGFIRDNLEAFGVAILAAVLLKYFAIEAYQIPTSSMQPTMMGSNEAGVYDRILVDKITPLLREPQRWDVTVFRYPLQKNQNYVKRLVGLPGDILRIGGGNLHTVTETGNDRTFQVLRKPEHIQQGLWKEVYPLRRLVRGDTRLVGSGASFRGAPARPWSEDGETLQAELEKGQIARLYFEDVDGGMVDRVWDGYPVGIAHDIRAAQMNSPLPIGQEIVPDVRFDFVVEPAGTLEELACEIDVTRPGRDRLVYALQVKGGQGRLVVLTGGDRREALASPPFPFAVQAGTRVTFWRLDDELVACRDGAELQRLDAAAFPVRDGCEIDPATGDNRPRAAVLIALQGQGRVALRDLRLCRDLHYTSSTFLPPDHLIRVPAGHYYMMGDNTQQSVDSRGWTAIRVGVTADGEAVPPTAADAVRVIRGNLRPVPSVKAPDRDETPVLIPSRQTMVMIDEYGEIHRLRTGVSEAFAQGRESTLRLEPVGSTEGRQDWVPPEEKVPFVPREDIQGRALLVFWPVWPMRLGFIR